MKEKTILMLDENQLLEDVIKYVENSSYQQLVKSRFPIIKI